MAGYASYRPPSPAGLDHQHRREEDHIDIISPSATAVESFHLQDTPRMGQTAEQRMYRSETADSMRKSVAAPMDATTIPPFDFRQGMPTHFPLPALSWPFFRDEGTAIDTGLTDGQPSLDLHDPRPSYEPVEDLDEHYPLLEDDELRHLGVDFHSTRQLLRLLTKGFLRWLVTAILIIGLFFVVSTYHTEPVMSNMAKKTFNFLVIGLSIALSLNVTSSLKAMATNMRWYILSRRKRSLREVDLILHLDSLFAIMKLGYVAPRFAPLCFIWLLLNLVCISYAPRLAQSQFFL